MSGRNIGFTVTNKCFLEQRPWASTWCAGALFWAAAVCSLHVPAYGDFINRDCSCLPLAVTQRCWNKVDVKALAVQDERFTWISEKPIFKISDLWWLMFLMGKFLVVFWCPFHEISVLEVCSLWWGCQGEKFRTGLSPQNKPTASI